MSNKNTDKTDATTAAADATGTDNGVNKLDELVPFHAPYHPGALENDLHITHNGYTITVKRGVDVMIPRGHKKVYDRSQRLLKEAQERARKRQEQYKNAGK